MPTALSHVSGARVYTILLYLAISLMSLDVCTLNIECLVTAIYDDWYNLNGRDKSKLRREWVTAGVVFTAWISGLPYYLNTGYIWLDVMDFYLFTFIG